MTREWKLDDPVTQPCFYEDHGVCVHVKAGRVDLIRGLLRRPYDDIVLCACTCHDQCPLAGRATTTTEIWKSECTCQDRLSGQD